MPIVELKQPIAKMERPGSKNAGTGAGQGRGFPPAACGESRVLKGHDFSRAVNG